MKRNTTTISPLHHVLSHNHLRQNHPTCFDPLNLYNFADKIIPYQSLTSKNKSNHPQARHFIAAEALVA